MTQPNEESEFYPGSSRKIMVKVPPRSVPQEVRWDGNPRMESVRGVEIELFTIGDLARALKRKSGTVRKWERLGWIPRATYRATGTTSNGNRRLYSRPQIEGILHIAREEGVMHPGAGLAGTQFTARVIALWKELS